MRVVLVIDVENEWSEQRVKEVKEYFAQSNDVVTEGYDIDDGYNELEIDATDSYKKMKVNKRFIAQMQGLNMAYHNFNR